MISIDDLDAEGKVEGALTQGLRLLRQQADLSPIAFSPPESPLFTQTPHDSLILSTQPEDNEGSFLFQTANDDSHNYLADQVEILDSSADVDEIPATPAASPPLPARRLMSVVTVRRNASPQRNTPIHDRLRALATSNSAPAPTCAYCSKPDGRKETIQCGACKLHIHSVSCAGFLSHRHAKHTAFTCRKCVDPPILRLPHASTPIVSDRVVITSHGPLADDSLPVNDYFPVDLSFVSPPPSPAATSSHQSQLHASPDHAHLASRAAEPETTDPRLPFSLDELFEAKVVLLRHCPKTARRELASLLNSVWSDVLYNADNVENWTKAFAAAKLVLFLPPGKRTFKDKAATVKQRITAFREGRLEKLWREAIRKPKGKRAAAAPQSANNARRATTLAQEFSQAAKALLSQGLDFDSEEAMESMRAKHPTSPPPPALPPPDASPYSFNTTETLNALNSFHSLSAGGASGCRAAHFREAITSDRGNALLTTMTRLINFLAAGKTPATVSPFLCGGNLFAALKKNGGHRPIAVGETIRRWTAKCVARKATADSVDHLAPHQLGVGVKGGAEAIIHAAGAIFHDNTIKDEDKWVLQIDFENAFNLISRSKILEEIRKHCPKAAKWAETCYASPSHLFFGNKRLSSSSGAQQGDPLASLFFSLVLQPLIQRIKEECPDLLLLVFFLDDGTIVGQRGDLQKVFDLLSSEGPALGLRLNPEKSSIWCEEDLPSHVDTVDPLDRGVPRTATAGFHLLGAPIGNIPFSRDAVEDRIQKIAEIFDRLPDIGDAQTEFALLRSCFSLPKLTYCLRTCDPAHLLPSYKKFDSLQFSTFSHLFGRQLDNDAKIQAFLPVKNGGVGLRSAEQHSSAAFIASNIQSRQVVDKILPSHITRRSLHNAFTLLQRFTGNASFTSEELLPPDSNQHSLSHEIDSNFGKILLSKASARDSARLHSLSLPHAGDWLDAVPSPSLGLHLDTRSFGVAIGYRLGISLLKPGECRATTCNQQIDTHGDHAMHCHDDNGLKAGRHDRIRDCIYKEAQHASLNPMKEMPGLVPNSQSRPADVYIANWVDGRKMAFDVSVVSPTQDAILHHAADSAAAAIEMRKTTKNRANHNGFLNCPKSQTRYIFNCFARFTRS